MISEGRTMINHLEMMRTIKDKELIIRTQQDLIERYAKRLKDLEKSLKVIGDIVKST